MNTIAQFWNDSIVPTLVEYIRIPAKSPHFDKAWAANGHIDAAVELAADWCRKNAIEGMKLEVVRLEGRTPLLFIEVPATRGAEGAGTVLLYGHLDKQPEMTGWAEGRASATESSTAAAGRTTATRCSLPSRPCAPCAKRAGRTRAARS
jgi:acetylornithine deacetylase/succinyl-diaminopimelate desuccinylase-like protein